MTTTPAAQTDSPYLPDSIWHAYSEEDSVPEVNQLYADLDHAKATTIELYLDDEISSDDDDPAAIEERAKLAARLVWEQMRFGGWELVYADKTGMARFTTVYIGERHVLAKPKTAAS